MSILKKLGFFVALLFSVTASFAEQSHVSLSETSAPPVLSPELQEYQNSLLEMLNIVDAFCSLVYPKPTLAECVDKVKHAVGQSFDPHSEYLNESDFQLLNESLQGEFAGIGAEMKKSSDTSPVLIVKVRDGPAKKAGIISGDVITHITTNGRRSSTASLTITEIVNLLRGEVGSTLSLTIMRRGEQKEMIFTFARELIKVEQIKGELLQREGKTYALITNLGFNRGNAKEMKRVFQDLEQRSRKTGQKLSGVILNLENNRGGLLSEVYNGIDLFLDAPSTILTRDNEGMSIYKPRSEEIVATPGDITRGLPMLVVVNGGCASACEILSASLKHFGRAVIAGTSATYGKGIVQSIFPTKLFGVADKGAVKVTTSEYLIGSPDDWTPVQCLGVSPDILFEYPNIKTPSSPKECEAVRYVNSKGPMPNAPIHLPINKANPKLYQAGEEMLKAFIAHQTPLLEEEKNKRKQEEEEER